ncbi:unnamed protein product [Didymodactylos carnosus]|uniref:Tudor domain-containing protein n=1 Tax=Didymodactylos carnosus TaxID=1234261 RepID=A0A8S2H589_9BILA|nr:unnamed protein product [Didymodactylos carnosus]CAF3602629.1 unnamed protein product [Didymodactylos carnosus]
MLHASILFNERQVNCLLPQNPSVDEVYDTIAHNLPSATKQENIVQLYDPALEEYFDLNEDNLQSWMSMSSKYKENMKLQIIQGGLKNKNSDINDFNTETELQNGYTQKLPDDAMIAVFEKLRKDIHNFVTLVQSLNRTAECICQEFDSAVAKFRCQSKENSLTMVQQFNTSTTRLPPYSTKHCQPQSFASSLEPKQQSTPNTYANIAVTAASSSIPISSSTTKMNNSANILQQKTDNHFKPISVPQSTTPATNVARVHPQPTMTNNYNNSNIVTSPNSQDTSNQTQQLLASTIQSLDGPSAFNVKKMSEQNASQKQQTVHYPCEDIRFKDVLASSPSSAQPQFVPSHQQRKQQSSTEEQIEMTNNATNNGVHQDSDISNPTMQQLQFPDVNILRQIYKTGDDLQTTVSIAVNPSYFYMQNIKYLDDFTQMVDSMNEYYSESDPPRVKYFPPEFGFCAARYTVDERWYRARVKRYINETTIEAFYLDYGNYEDVSIDQVRPLDPVFATLPAQAICASAEILPSSDNVAWSRQAICQFSSDTLNKTFDADAFRSVGHGQTYFAQKHPKRSNEVVAADILQSQRKTQGSVSRNEKTASTSTMNIITKPSSRITSLPSITLNLKDNLGSCHVTSATSPTHFFIQLEEQNSFQYLYEQIQDIYIEQISCDKVQRLKNIQKDSVGVGKNPKDQRYYRVQVISLDREKKNVLALCIDFGDYCSISAQSLYELLPEYRQIPPQTIKCRLSSVKPIEEDWTRESIVTFNKFFGGHSHKSLRFRVAKTCPSTIKLGDQPLQITLFDLSTSGKPVSINEILVQKKLALPDECYEQEIRAAYEAITDVDDIKRQRIIQYIEQQRQLNETTYSKEQEAHLLHTEKAEHFHPPLPISHFQQIPQQQSLKCPPLYSHQLNEEQTPTSDGNTGGSGTKGFSIQHPQSSTKTTTSHRISSDSEQMASVKHQSTVLLQPFLPTIEPELSVWYAVEVTYVRSPSDFFIRFPYGTDYSLGRGAEPLPIPDDLESEQNVELNNLQRHMAEKYDLRRNIATQIMVSKDELVAIKYQSRWYRGRVIEFKDSVSFALVDFVDQGDRRELGTGSMRRLDSDFQHLPCQAYNCRLFGVNATEDWNIQDTDLFKKKIRDKILFARKVEEPNFVQLVDRVDGIITSFDTFWNKLHHTNRMQQQQIPQHDHGQSHQHQRKSSSQQSKTGTTVSQQPTVHQYQLNEVSQHPPLPPPPSQQRQQSYNSTQKPSFVPISSVTTAAADIVNNYLQNHPQSDDQLQRSVVSSRPVKNERFSNLVHTGYGSSNGNGSNGSGNSGGSSKKTQSKEPLKFVSAGFTHVQQETAHLSPNAQLEQIQQRAQHRIQPTNTTVPKEIRHYQQQQYEQEQNNGSDTDP